MVLKTILFIYLVISLLFSFYLSFRYPKFRVYELLLYGLFTVLQVVIYTLGELFVFICSLIYMIPYCFYICIDEVVKAFNSNFREISTHIEEDYNELTNNDKNDDEK
jgi:hypothetical protein